MNFFCCAFLIPYLLVFASLFLFLSSFPSSRFSSYSIAVRSTRNYSSHPTTTWPSFHFLLLHFLLSCSPSSSVSSRSSYPTWPRLSHCPPRRIESMAEGGSCTILESITRRAREGYEGARTTWALTSQDPRTTRWENEDENENDDDDDDDERRTRCLIDC